MGAVGREGRGGGRGALGGDGRWEGVGTGEYYFETGSHEWRRKGQYQD